MIQPTLTSILSKGVGNEHSVHVVVGSVSAMYIEQGSVDFAVALSEEIINMCFKEASYSRKQTNTIVMLRYKKLYLKVYGFLAWQFLKASLVDYLVNNAIPPPFPSRPPT